MSKLTRRLQIMLHTAAHSPVAWLLLVSFALNAWWLSWGLPDYKWHWDEIVEDVCHMAKSHSLVPPHYWYGAWHYYTLLIVLSPYLAACFLRYGSDIVHAIGPAAFYSQTYLISRVVSAAMGTGAVYLCYLLGSRCAGRRCGLLAGSFLAFSGLFVCYAHFATVDVPLVFWVALGLYLCVLYAETGRPRVLVWAGLVGGLALATKLSALPILLCLAYAWLARWRADARAGEASFRAHSSRAALLTGSVLLAFAIGNPNAIVHYAAYYRENLENLSPLREAGVPSYRGILQMLQASIFAVGWPCAALAVVGIGVAFPRRAAGWQAPAVVGCFAIPALASYQGFSETHTWWCLPLLIAFALFAGIGADAFCHAGRHRWVARLGAGVVVAAVAFSLVNAVLVAYCFQKDARFAAADFIRSRIPATDTIETTPYSPLIGSGRPVFTIPFPTVRLSGKFAEAKPEMKRAYYRMAGKDEATEARAEQEAAENMRTEYAKLAETLSPEGLARRAPQWIVLSDLFTQRFSAAGWPSTHAYLDDLAQGRLGYHVAARFHTDPPWSLPTEFVNPHVTILERDTPALVSQPMPTPQ